MINSPARIDAILNDLKAELPKHKERLKEAKEMLVKSQRFEEAEKIRSVERNLESLLQQIEKSYIKFS